MPGNKDQSGKFEKDLINQPSTKSKPDGRGGARKGAGKKSLQDKNMESRMVKLSMKEDTWRTVDMYHELRSKTKFKVDVIRDMLSAITEILDESGLSPKEQAEATHDLKSFLKEHFSQGSDEK
ncbi:hypothetical protein [Paenibacillus sp. 1A_MP2]|uniref:hypothetical protein n=1 Tax=Paenibacillus sp. 1A_MP2 TaxID=3457495 RepID=UPI003FCE2C90